MKKQTLVIVEYIPDSTSLYLLDNEEDKQLIELASICNGKFMNSMDTSDSEADLLQKLFDALEDTSEDTSVDTLPFITEKHITQVYMVGFLQ